MTVMVVRPSGPGDLDQVFGLAKRAGTGMTNLPPDRDTLAARIDESRASFAAETSEPGAETYLFVLEDTDTGAIAGTSGIYARIGFGKPFYSYKILQVTQISHELDITVTSRLLHLVNDFTGCTEIGMLFLDPDYRKDGNGRLLGMTRFLMMAEFPERFAELVMAEMRGWFDEKGRSPFWEGLGKHFFGMAFPKVDYMSAVSNNQFISDLMPKYPIYIDLLAPEAQAVIGKPHTETRPALELLRKEGFRYQEYVDIFDAGPAVQVRLQDIRTVRDSRKRPIRELHQPADMERSGDFEYHYVANCRLPDFSVCRALLRVNDDGAVGLCEEAANALKVAPGDPVRFVSTSTSSNK
ncbi:MAG: arginine N-succinyltransferase [Sphingomonadales bacterium]